MRRVKHLARWLELALMLLGGLVVVVSLLIGLLRWLPLVIDRARIVTYEMEWSDGNQTALAEAFPAVSSRGAAGQ